MKTIVFTLVFGMYAMFSNAQNTYLKITSIDTTTISYPPHTSFELKNELGYIVFKNNHTPSIFLIDKPHVLTVFPSYKVGKDVYHLTDGKLELAEIRDYESRGTYDYVSNGVIANFIVSDSKKIKGSKNIVFTLSNGIIFNYTDGKYYAYLHNEENFLNIEGKYLVESDYGILKISFNPKNGEVWWVFDKI